MILKLTNHKTSAVTDVVITDELPDGLTFVEIEDVQGVQMSSIETDTDTPNEVSFKLDLNDGGGLAAGEEIIITYKAATDADKYSIQLYLDDIPDASNTTNGRWLIDTESDLADSPNVWGITSDEGNNDNFSWNVDDITTETRQLLIHFDPIRITGAQPVLRFYQRYDSYPGQHGGVLELSNDGAVSFQNNSDIFFRNGYSGLMPYSAFTIPNFRAFSGQSGDFIGSYADLSSYDGDDVFFRFRFGTCLLYTSPSPRDATLSRMPSSA